MQYPVGMIPDVVEGPHWANSEEIVDAEGVEAVAEQSLLDVAVREEGHQTAGCDIPCYGGLCAISDKLD